jgi:hypothetical protein
MAEEQPAGIGPVYLTLDDVLELYGLIIGATVREARDQLRNRDGLEGALARPRTYAHYQTQISHYKRPCWLTASPRASTSSMETSAPALVQCLPS